MYMENLLTPTSFDHGIELNLAVDVDVATAEIGTVATDERVQQTVVATISNSNNQEKVLHIVEGAL